MPRIRKIFFIISTVSLVLNLCYQNVFASEIKISPVLENEDYYIMKLGDVQTFEADGIGWDNDRQEKIPGVGIEALEWNFDSRFLELVEKEDNAITLRAIKKRTSKLTATGEVSGKHATKTVFIVIGDGR